MSPVVRGSKLAIEETLQCHGISLWIHLTKWLKKKRATCLALVVPFLGSCWEHICSLLQNFYLSLADGKDTGCLFLPEPLQLFSLFSYRGSSKASPKSLRRHGMFTNVQNSLWVEYLRVSTDVLRVPGEWEGLCSSHVSRLTLNPNSVPLCCGILSTWAAQFFFPLFRRYSSTVPPLRL